MRALLGLQSTKLRVKERELLSRLRAPGVLLLRHNLSGAGQLAELCAEVDAIVRENCGHAAIIAVDEEGGAVSPLTPAIGESMSAAGCGVVDDLDFTRSVHAERARRARELGVSLLLAPVADVNRPGNPVIATRAFGHDGDQVSRQVRAALEGLWEGGVRNCVKHWPGHGAVEVDSHYRLPRMLVSPDEWKRVDLPPFEQALASGLADAVMVAHLRADFLTGNDRETTTNRRVVHDWLREELGFEGAILSDALEMGAFEQARPSDALAAGCDLLLLATPVERLRTEVLEEIALEHSDDEASGQRIRNLAEARPGSAVGGSLPLEFDVRCVKRVGGESGETPKCWMLVDAASQDRLLRPPEGIDSLRSEDPRVSVSLLGPDFEGVWGPPAAEIRLGSNEELPGGVADALEVDCCVVASVRPLSRALMDWLEVWLSSRPQCGLLLLGAVAVDGEGPAERVLAGRTVWRCPELHGAARKGVARAISQAGSC